MNKEPIIIFGTGIQARAFYRVSGKQFNIICFLKSDYVIDGELLFDIPVICVSEAEDLIKQYPVYIATIDKYYDEVKEKLIQLGFEKIYSMSFESMAWTNQRIPYLRDLFLERYNRKFCLIDEMIEGLDSKKYNAENLSLFCIMSPFDNANIKIPQNYGYEKMLLAGASFCDDNQRQLLESQYKELLFDCDGDSISSHNKTYCELTGMYWIWKNYKADYKGLCHYRRHFAMNEKELSTLKTAEIDVVLTVPIVNYSSVYEIYQHDHCIEDLVIMMEAMKELQPEYVNSMEEILSGNFYSGYNMLVAKEAIFDEYCTWLFPILDYCEAHCEKKQERYQERFVGFLAERLMTIYFWHNWDKYHIVYSRKEYLE